jgi:syntaxin-binding protein 5
MFLFVFLKVAMFDTSQLSIIFSGDCASGTNSPVVSLSISNVSASAANDDQSKKGTPQSENFPRDVFLSLTKDARVTLLDSTIGVMISSHLLDHKQTSAVSMYVIGK